MKLAVHHLKPTKYPTILSSKLISTLLHKTRTHVGVKIAQTSYTNIEASKLSLFTTLETLILFSPSQNLKPWLSLHLDKQLRQVSNLSKIKRLLFGKTVRIIRALFRLCHEEAYKSRVTFRPK